MGNLTKSKELLLQKLEMIEEDNHKEKQYTYNQLGLVHHELKSFDQALSYFQQMIDLETDAKPSRFRGQAYHNMANIYQEQKHYEQAWDYYEKALKEKGPIGREKDLLITYKDMAFHTLIHDQINLDYSEQYKALDSIQKDLIAQGKGYKMDLITTNYFNEQREKEHQQKFYLTLFSGLIFLWLAGFVSVRLWRIYRFESPEIALSTIKNPKELIYLFDRNRKEKEELKNTLKQYEKH